MLGVLKLNPKLKPTDFQKALNKIEILRFRNNL